MKYACFHEYKNLWTKVKSYGIMGVVPNMHSVL
jgi:hypothetical protein